MKTKQIKHVVFRTFLDDGRVIALFPFEPHDIGGRYCVSYQNGQHGAANQHTARLPSTRPSFAAEFYSLYRELERIGYKLKVLKRFPRNAYSVRRQKA